MSLNSTALEYVVQYWRIVGDVKTEVFGVGLVNCQTAGQDVEEGELEPYPAPALSGWQGQLCQ